MMQVACPHCGNPAMTPSQKLWLGPARKRACKGCGKFVSVPWWTGLFLLPCFFSVMGVNESVGITGLAWITVLGSSLILFCLSHAMTSLVPRR
jgi:hypothetical protein